MAQKDLGSSSLQEKLQAECTESSSCGNIICLERKEDGKLIGAHLTYIRSCMKDMLSQIWSADIIERQREGHQRANSPASELAEDNEVECALPHVNYVD